MSECPKTLGEFYASDWILSNKTSTPDLYSMCAPKKEQANPSNHWCRIIPFSDSSFAGILLSEKLSEYREYISTRLSKTLKKDSVYTFQIALAVPYFSRWKTEFLDVVFTNQMMVQVDSYIPVIRKSSFSIPLKSMQTEGTWFIYTIDYIADGTERYFNIGNFHSTKNTNLTLIEDRNDEIFRTLYNSAYICLDEVIISPKSTFDKIEKKNILTNSDKEYRFHFLSGSAEIEKKDLAELNKLVNILKSKPSLKISIEGHTDSTGSKESNRILSQKRAESLMNYLLKNGIPKERMSIKGYGDEKSISENTTANGKAQNRRVEIKIK